jgi:hypothetical protein
MNWSGATSVAIGFTLGNILMGLIFTSDWGRVIEISFFQISAIFATAYVLQEKKTT